MSLVDDSDNVVPADSTLQVAAQLSYTAEAAQSVAITEGALRVSGSQEWESNGRSRLPVRAETLGHRPNGTGSGTSVAVWDNNGTIVAVAGAPTATVEGLAGAGQVDVFEGGVHTRTLTAPTPAAGAGFGTSVDVAGGYIVVGEPDVDAPTNYGATRAPGGKAYVFSVEAGAHLATFEPSAHTGGRQIIFFGTGVAISDDGNTIVASANPASSGPEANYPDDADNDNVNDRERYWGTAYLFSKADSAAWTGDYSTDGSAADHSDGATVLRSRGRFNEGYYGEVDISGDGSVVAAGATYHDVGGVHSLGMVVLFEKPNAGWAKAC